MTEILNSPFTRESTAEEVLSDINDLENKVVIVTGANSGIGTETARVFAQKGAHVFVCARSEEKAQGAVDSIRTSTGNDKVESLIIDLGSFESIRGAANTFLALDLPLHILINNAGIMACPESKTKDGIETQFGVNHVGHFLFTGLLFPALKRAAEEGVQVRVVNLSSIGHRFGIVNLKDWNYENSEYNKWNAYGRSKTANIWFSIELNRRLRNENIGSSFAVHPGAIMTNLGKHLTPDDYKGMGAMDEEGNLKEDFLKRSKSIPQGAATTCFAATSPILDNLGGIYLEDVNSYTVNLDGGTDFSKKGPGVHCYDRDGARQLWLLSEKLVGESFDFGQ